MPGTIRYLSPGEQSEAALQSRVAHLKKGDPLAPVTIAVRSPLAGRDLRRRLAARGSMAGVGFVPLTRLAELLAAADEGSRRPLSRPVLGAAVRAALAERPGIFAPVAAHPATEESLARTYRIIRQLEEDEVAQLASMSKRASDVVALAKDIRARLGEGCYDSEDLTSAAADLVTAGRGELSDIGSIIVHLPDPLGRAERRLLHALAGRLDLVVHLGLTGDTAADRGPLLLGEQLGELGFSSEKAPSGSAPGLSRVLGAPDAEEEVRSCLRLLMEQVAEGGELGRVAIALPGGSRESYLSLIDELFGAAGVPWTSAGRGELAASGLGLLAVRVLALVAEPGRPFERSSVLEILASPFLREGGSLLEGLSWASLSHGRLRVGALERISRLAGVVAGEAEWEGRVGYLERRRREDGRERAALCAHDLVLLIGRLGELGRRFDAASDWVEIADVAVAVARSLGPPDEDRERLEDALGELAQLEGIEALVPAAQSEGRASQLQAAFGHALSGRDGGRGRFGEGPVVGSLGELAGLRADLLIVLGAGEGFLPGRSPEDPLVNEVEREASPTLRSAERREEADRRWLLWLLGGAGESVAFYPRVGRGAARPAYPSRWLTGDLFDGEHEQIPSYAAAVRAVAAGGVEPADSADLELALAFVAGPAGIGKSFLSRLDDFGRRLLCERERHRPGLSRFAGRLGPTDADGELFSAVMSATKMENLARCPLQFMFERLARVDVLDAPERLPVIEPKVRGTLIHQVLEDFVAATMEPGGKEHWDDPQLVLLNELAAERFKEAERKGLTGKDVYWQMVRRRILSDLERFVTLERARLRTNDAVPVRTEMGFGDEEIPPVTLSLPNGRAVSFRGKIDRVDREADGRLRVIDYKSGRDKSYAGMRSDPLDGGRHLQLPIYAKAARQLLPEETGEVVAEYRFCSSEAGFRTLPVALTSALDTKLSEAVGVLCETVERGVFPPRPGNGNELQPSNCRSCDYDSICRLDRTARWEEAASAEEMADYVELVKGQRQ